MFAIKTKVTAAMVAALTVIPAAGAVAQQVDTPAQARAQDQHQGRFQGDLFDAVLDHIGVNRGEVVSWVRTGGTLAELADEQGSSGEALVAAMMEVVDARIDEAIANGADPERAAEFRESAEARITDVVFSRHDGNQGVGNSDAKGLILDTVTELLGVNRGRVISWVRTGGTLAELAQEHGSSGEALEAALVGAVQQRVDEAIASGKITVERGLEIVENATARIGEIVNEVHTPGRGR